MKRNKDPVRLVVYVHMYDMYNLRFHTMKFTYCTRSEALYVASVYAKIMFWKIQLITTIDL